MRDPTTGVWSTGQELLPPTWTGFGGAEYGFGVATDGTWAVVSARHQDVGSLTQVGKAYVFRNDSGSWNFEQDLDPLSPGASEKQFGNSVDVDGGWLVVGARKFGVAESGEVYAFKYDPQGIPDRWYQTPDHHRKRHTAG